MRFLSQVTMSNGLFPDPPFWDVRIRALSWAFVGLQLWTTSEPVWTILPTLPKPHLLTVGVVASVSYCFKGLTLVSGELGVKATINEKS